MKTNLHKQLLALTASLSVLVACSSFNGNDQTAPLLNGKLPTIALKAGVTPLDNTGSGTNSGDQNCQDGKDCGTVNQKSNTTLSNNHDVSNGHNTYSGSNNVVADNAGVVNIIGGTGVLCGCSASPGPSPTPTPVPSGTPGPSPTPTPVPTPTPTPTPTPNLRKILFYITAPTQRIYFSDIVGKLNNIGFQTEIHDPQDLPAQDITFAYLNTFSQVWIGNFDDSPGEVLDNIAQQAIVTFRNSNRGVLLLGEYDDRNNHNRYDDVQAISQLWNGPQFVGTTGTGIDNYFIDRSETQRSDLSAVFTVQKITPLHPILSNVTQLLGFYSEAGLKTNGHDAVGIGWSNSQYAGDGIANDQYLIAVTDSNSLGRVVYEGCDGRFINGSFSPDFTTYLENIAKWLQREL